MTNLDDIDKSKILYYLLENCKSNKIYYVHNLTFETFVFLPYLIKEKIDFRINISRNKVYMVKILFNNKEISMRCSYNLTLLPLRELAKMCDIGYKQLFPYSILNENYSNNIPINEDHFNSKDDYNNFIFEFGKYPNIDKILMDYCINDSVITKKSIIEY